MTKVKLSEVIRRCQTRADRYDTNLLYYVAGEHFESGEIDLAGRGEIAGSTIGPMFYYGFKPGDFLLVSRNPHLRKASRVDFAGVCSEKTFVLETADESVLSNEYLPWVLQNDRFWNYAQENRHGSTNFFINWSTLADYVFELPSIEDQKQIATILWAAQSVRRNYRKLLKACDDVVKSQFVEMFGDEKWNFKPLSECVNSIDTGKSMNCGEGPRGVGGFGVLKLSALSSGTFVASENKVISKDNFMSIKEVEKGDLLFARKNTPELVGTTVYVPNEVKGLMFPDLVFRMKPKDVNALYLLAYMRSDRGLDLIQGMAHGSAKSMVNIPKTQLARLPVPVPPLELQQEFADFVAQVDKSKFAIQKALDELNATTKKILNQELGLGDV